MTLESIALRRRLAESDLLTGAEELAQMAAHGLPQILREAGCEDPKAVLLRLCSSVTPSDLQGGAAALWKAAADRWQAGRAASLEGALSHVPENQQLEAGAALKFARAHGMGLPYTAPVAAARLLALSSALDTLREARAVEVAALSEAVEAMRGVV